jgi:5'-methylthioinosine phosphorylase
MIMDLAVIGGTGLYDLAGLDKPRRVLVETPYGPASGPVVVGALGGRRIGFLARHGANHTVAPHRINYRANLWALHHLGARRVLGINAVGGIGEAYGPRVLAVPHQLIDYTWGRVSTFADEEKDEVRHIDFTDPYDAGMRQQLLEAAKAANVAVVDTGVYAATQGPRLETAAEIKRLRQDGADVVGMTGMPEAVLARELELKYACLALVANWAAGCGDQATISMDEIYANLRACTERVPAVVGTLLAALPAT